MALFPSLPPMFGKQCVATIMITCWPRIPEYFPDYMASGGDPPQASSIPQNPISRKVCSDAEERIFKVGRSVREVGISRHDEYCGISRFVKVERASVISKSISGSSPARANRLSPLQMSKGGYTFLVFIKDSSWIFRWDPLAVATARASWQN